MENILEANVFADNFSQTFTDELSFRRFIQEREEHSKWEKHPTQSIKAIALEDGSKKTDTLRKKFVKEDNEEVLNDTLRNTQLLLKTPGSLYPVRTCAIKTILDRANISGNALRKVRKPVFAEILNRCLHVASGDALIRLSEGKVSAVHGGDSGDYGILPVPALIEKTIDYLQMNFPDFTFAGGFYDHSMVTALWKLGDPQLIKTYVESLDLHGVSHGELFPTLRLSTSDVGISSASLIPSLESDGRTITLGSPLRLIHKAGSTLEQFENQLKMIYTQYKKAIDGLAGLLDIYVRHPEYCMKSVCKAIRIPKKRACDATELFIAQNGSEPCTAHDIYYAISEVVFAENCDGASGSKIVAMEEKVAAALSVRWSDHDLAGEFKW